MESHVTDLTLTASNIIAAVALDTAVPPPPPPAPVPTSIVSSTKGGVAKKKKTARDDDVELIATTQTAKRVSPRRSSKENVKEDNRLLKTEEDIHVCDPPVKKTINKASNEKASMKSVLPNHHITPIMGELPPTKVSSTATSVAINPTMAMTTILETEKHIENNIIGPFSVLSPLQHGDEGRRVSNRLRDSGSGRKGKVQQEVPLNVVLAVIEGPHMGEVFSLGGILPSKTNQKKTITLGRSDSDISLFKDEFISER